MIVNVAIVEDDVHAAELLKSHFDRFSQENEVSFQIETYSSPIMFLEKYNPDYDIVYMDIQMPSMNGLEAAKRLRAIDEKVILVFVTRLAQYAIDGYEVTAFDYMIKPVQYYGFAMKLTRILWRLGGEFEDSISFSTDFGLARVRTRDIKYIEVRGHMLTYHTYGGTYNSFGSLSNLDEELREKGFARCNSCYLVNLKYVKGIKGYTAYLADEIELKISQPRKKQFVSVLQDYYKDS